METVTSMKNPKVLFWRSLKQAKYRAESGCFLVEGVRMVEEALASSFPVEALLADESCSLLPPLPASVPVYRLPEHVLASVCDTKTPQGLAAVLRHAPRPASGPRLLALDGLQDPGNVGTMIRTADAAGLTGILVSPDCADVFSPKVLRATMGSVFRMGLSFPSSLPEELARLRSGGYDILSSQLDGSAFYDYSASGKWVLIIGNEGNGVSPEVRAEATHCLKLPMRGGAESLNAAVAAGIMMYELTRGLSRN